MMIMSFLIPHHTELGKQKANDWRAFRKYLRKYLYRNESNEELLSKINDLFVYGCLFGIRKKSFKELSTVLPIDKYNQFLPWYILHSNRKGAFTPAALGDALSTMISTTGSTMSSASGAGGGASSGGGGGAGSGGGGAG